MIICPYCHTLVAPRKLIKKNNFDWGFYRCSCDEYPLVAGVLYLTKDDEKRNFKCVSLIKKNNYISALDCLLNGSKLENFFLRLVITRGLKERISYRGFIFFLSLFSLQKKWYTYLVSRQSSRDLKQYRTFFSIQSPVLDIGSGTSFFLKNISKSVHYIGLDNNFFLLLIASVFFGNKNRMFICCDVNIKIPIMKNRVNSVLMMDSFPFLFAKKMIIAELARVLTKKAELGIVNIFIKNRKTSAWGYGISLLSLKKILRDTFFLKRVIKNDEVGYSIFAHKI